MRFLKLLELCLKLLFGLRDNIFCFCNRLKHFRCRRVEEVEELFLKLADTVYRHLLKIAIDCRINNNRLALESHRIAILLLQNRHHTLPAVNAFFGVGVEVLSKLHKGLELSKL